MNRARSLLLLPGLLMAAAAVAQEPPKAPPPETKTETPTAARPKVETSPKRPATLDRLELDTTEITGNRELPKVLYIVPWKKSDLGDLTGRPTNSLLDEVLAPVDREVFRRQTAYHEKLSETAAETNK